MTAACAPTVERLLGLQQILDVAVSPDGARIAYVAGDAFTRPGQPRQSRIWETGTRGGAPRQLTQGPGSELLPRWSPDGRTVAYASDCETPGFHSLHLLCPGEGDARRLEGIAGSVEDIQWSRDGRRIAVLAADPGSDRAGTQTATKVGGHERSAQDPEVTRPREAWRRVQIVDVQTERIAYTSPAGVNVWELHWDGGSTVAAVVSDDPAESAWYRARLALLDVEQQTLESVYVPEWQLQCPRLSPAGDAIAFVEGVCSDRGILVGTVTLLALDSPAPAPLAPHLDAGWLDWRDDERLWYAGWRRMGSMVGLLGRDGSVEELWEGKATIGDRYRPRASPSADGAVVAAVLESPEQPPEIAVLDVAAPSKGMRTVTALNRDLATLATPVTERLAWRSADGLEIEGLVVRPEGSDGRRLPLVVIVHGGPTATWTYHFTCWARASSFAAAGYAVLLPNPRGSAGRGQPFARANVGDVGGGDLDDILAGVDALVDAGVADRDRVGITGVSYGGFMSGWAITQSARFAAAVPVAGISDWISFHFTTNVGRFDELFLDADPYEGAGVYVQRSPVAHAPGTTTPTLILHGELDLCTPVGQARELYRALVDAGTEAELVVYPREGHAFLEHDHQIDAFERIRAWFDRHLAERR